MCATLVEKNDRKVNDDRMTDCWNGVTLYVQAISWRRDTNVSIV